MTSISEIDAMREFEKILLQLEDKEARKRVLDWACSKFSPSSLQETNTRVVKTVPKRKKALKKPENSKRSKRTSYAIVRELNLRPKGKKSFKDFFKEKQPKSQQGVAALAVYYLQKIIEQPNITANHVYSCFKDIKYRLYSRFDSSLQVVASRTAWIDTKHMNDIKMTPSGENYIEQDLPPAASKKA